VTPNESVFGVGYNSGYLSAFFHKGGASSFYPNPNLCEAFAATTQANNQPIAVGQCGSTPVVTRYVGVPGNGFGFDPAFNGGAAQSAGGTTGSFNAAAVDSAGRIVAVGIREYPSTPDDYLIVRYLANGALDPAFHDEENLPGRVSEPIFEHNDTALSVAIQPDGKIVVAGYSNSLTSSAGLATIARFNTDGSIDGSFGTAGKLVFHFGSGDAPIYGLAVQPNGKIVFVGSQYDSVAQKDSSLIGRLLSNGSFDESFAPGGILVGIPGSSESRAIGVGVLPDGKILVGELLGGSGHPVPAVVRLIGNDPIPATATILTPSKSKIKRKKFAKVTGAASGDGLAKVELAILKSDKKLLKKKRRCLQVSGKSKLTKVKAVKKKCVISKWLPVTGTAGWIFKLSKKLPAGKYTIYARATGSTGVQVTPTKKSLTLIK
jgi:uncharacterized delta-60 repeat protein